MKPATAATIILCTAFGCATALAMTGHTDVLKGIGFLILFLFLIFLC